MSDTYKLASGYPDAALDASVFYDSRAILTEHLVTFIEPALSKCKSPEATLLVTQEFQYPFGYMVPANHCGQDGVS
jgi:hypothetical protein